MVRGDTRGSLFITDGAVEVPYGERDVVIMWPCYMHAVIPPVVGHAPQEKHVSGGAVPRRMSYLHYTRRGRDPPPRAGMRIGDAGPEEVAGWRRAVFGIPDTVHVPRSRRR